MGLPRRHDSSNSTNSCSNTSSSSSSGSATNTSIMIQQRLKLAMQSNGNTQCIDCEAMKPTWATFVKAPIQDDLSSTSASSTTTVAALCCFHCSGYHRSLGTHICRVKSCTLDSCKFLYRSFLGFMAWLGTCKELSHSTNSLMDSFF